MAGREILQLNLYGIMMKFPEPGAVKTRLANAIGEAEAADAYREVAERVMLNTSPQNAGYERRVFYSPAGKLGEFSGWLPGEELLPQTGCGLGEIMSNALAALLSSGAAKAIITGADIPGLGREVIMRAFVALGNSDVVLGPASDGGYYLIGMTAPHPEIFQGIEWGAPTVCSETIGLIVRAGLSHATVDTLSDLDTYEDYLRLIRKA